MCRNVNVRPLFASPFRLVVSAQTSYGQGHKTTSRRNHHGKHTLSVVPAHSLLHSINTRRAYSSEDDQGIITSYSRIICRNIDSGMQQTLLSVYFRSKKSKRILPNVENHLNSVACFRCQSISLSCTRGDCPKLSLLDF